MVIKFLLWIERVFFEEGKTSYSDNDSLTLTMTQKSAYKKTVTKRHRTNEQCSHFKIEVKETQKMTIK